MSGAAAAAPALLHHHGVSDRATLPVYHGDCRFPPGACFVSTSPLSGSIRASLVCNASPNNHRPRNSDSPRQQNGGSSRGKNRAYQDKDDSESIDVLDSDLMLSKNGPPISMGNNSRSQATSVPGEREKEIVELFKRVQAQLRARGKSREDKKPESVKTQGDRGSVDSLLKLLRKHAVDQRKKSSDDKQVFDLKRRNNDPVSRQNSATFAPKIVSQEDQKKPQEDQKKPPAASLGRPASNFRRRSPVPGVKFQPVVNADKDADVIQEDKATLDVIAATDEPETVSPYEPDSVIAPENISLDDFDVTSDDESDTDEADDESDTDEADDEFLEPSLENTAIAEGDESHDTSAAGRSDLSSLKVAELRELAKSQGIKGYSKLKKVELVEILSNTA